MRKMKQRERRKGGRREGGRKMKMRKRKKEGRRDVYRNVVNNRDWSKSQLTSTIISY
jgi:hypothetical protein